MLNLIKMEVYKLKRQKLLVVLFAAVIAISAFSAFSQINLLTTPDNPVTGKMSFTNAFQDIFMLFIIAVLQDFTLVLTFLTEQYKRSFREVIKE